MSPKQLAFLAVLGQHCRDGSWPTVRQKEKANVLSLPLSLAGRCHPVVSSVLQTLPQLSHL